MGNRRSSSRVRNERWLSENRRPHPPLATLPSFVDFAEAKLRSLRYTRFLGFREEWPPAPSLFRDWAEVMVDPIALYDTYLAECWHDYLVLRNHQFIRSLPRESLTKPLRSPRSFDFDSGFDQPPLSPTLASRISFLRNITLGVPDGFFPFHHSLLPLLDHPLRFDFFLCFVHFPEPPLKTTFLEAIRPTCPLKYSRFGSDRSPLDEPEPLRSVLYVRAIKGETWRGRTVFRKIVLLEFLLEFDESGIVVPRTYVSDQAANFVAVECIVMMQNDISLLFRICQVLAEYNGSKIFKKRPNPSFKEEENCQTFIDDLLNRLFEHAQREIDELERQKPVLDKTVTPIIRSLGEFRWNDPIPYDFIVDEPLLQLKRYDTDNTVTHFNNYSTETELTIESHAHVCDIRKELYCRDHEYEIRHKNGHKILYLIHTMFWLKLNDAEFEANPSEVRRRREKLCGPPMHLQEDENGEMWYDSSFCSEPTQYYLCFRSELGRSHSLMFEAMSQQTSFYCDNLVQETMLSAYARQLEFQGIEKRCEEDEQERIEFLFEFAFQNELVRIVSVDQIRVLGFALVFDE